jgi:hypothetical protein
MIGIGERLTVDVRNHGETCNHCAQTKAFQRGHTGIARQNLVG